MLLSLKLSSMLYNQIICPKEACHSNVEVIQVVEVTIMVVVVVATKMDTPMESSHGTILMLAVVVEEDPEEAVKCTKMEPVVAGATGMETKSQQFLSEIIVGKKMHQL
jgi:adenosylmethionine-8-amino-7-oxononanoate aminotransferase